MEEKITAQDKDNTSVLDATKSLAVSAPVAIQPAHNAKKTKKTPAISAVLISAVVGFGGGWLGSTVSDQSGSTIDEKKIIMNSEGEVISDVAKTVGASVVSVNVTQQVTTNSYFGPRSSESQAAGTGIIISKDGLMLTNRHVVPEGTTSVSVTLSDGTTYDDVEVVGRTNANDSLDIAFLKIKDTKGKELTAAKIGDSSTVKVGERVVAIGNALGQFQNTVTTGILSGYGRSVVAGSEDGSSENLDNLFQTDAAINQGNSGGPLVNLAGEVIGVNVAIADDAQSVGFAIPINDVKGLIKSVETTGKVQRPYIGVVYLPITADVAKEYSLGVEQGAYVAPRGVSGQEPIVAGSPAEKAGLQANDIITKINNDQIQAGTSLTSLLGKYQVGDEVTLTIIRSGKTIELKLTLGTSPSS